MPIERSNAIQDLSDPNLVLGPRKRRATERVLENGDPLAKKKRKDNLSLGDAGVTVNNASADKGKHTSSLKKPAPAQQPQLAHAAPHARGSTPSTNGARGGDARTSDGAQAIVVEDGSDSDEGNNGSDDGATTDEDDDAELGMFSITLVYIC